MTEAILTRLAELSKLIESHQAAIFLLGIERAELQTKLRATEWKSPLEPAV